jgi:beta,beta-carotene 9',10'-dioxygenase
MRCMSGDYRLGLKTLDDEIVVDRLPVQGELPSWLAGTLIRNGPAMFDHAGKSFRHWFDGQAMLHRFEFTGGPDGGVSYANRLLDTLNVRSLRKRGRIGYQEFATDPCASLFGRFFTRFTRSTSANGCVNVTRVNGRSLAVSETNLAVQFEPDTLATVGVVGYGPQASGLITTAHPHAAPGSRDLVNYMLRFGRHSRYLVYRQGPSDAAPTMIGEIPADLPGYVHSFAITEHHVVLAIFPLVVNPLSFLLHNRPFIDNYQWQPDLGLRIVVLDLTSGALRADCRAPAAFAFHHINAYEDGNAIVMDLCAYPDAAIVDVFRLERLHEGEVLPPCRPSRYHIDPDAGTVDVTTLVDQTLDLPRINYGRHNGRPYRYAYGCGADQATSTFFDRLVKLDVADRTVTAWREDGCFPGEPVFIAAPDSSAEDEGVVLSVVLDAKAGRSALLVLDARSFSELARAEVPHAIPYGFHGQFTRARPT